MTDGEGGGPASGGFRRAGEGPGSPARVARFLRQRSELAGEELFLDGLDRHEVLELVRGFAEAGGEKAANREAAPAPADRDVGSEPEPGSRTEGPGAGGDESGADSLSSAERGVQQGAEGEETIRTFDYGTLKKVALGCERCRLCEERKQVVFSDGNPEGRLMVVGEAPGAREDRTGLPFVGPAGKLLDLLLAGVDLSREETAYICNVIKCRPPGNRNPLPDEIEACAPYLRRQIELVRPEAILAVGTFAGQLLTGRSSTLGKLRGEVYSYEGVPLVVTYHPAALLRNRSWTRSTWNDFQLLRQVLDGG